MDPIRVALRGIVYTGVALFKALAPRSTKRAPSGWTLVNASCVERLKRGSTDFQSAFGVGVERGLKIRVRDGLADACAEGSHVIRLILIQCTVRARQDLRGRELLPISPLETRIDIPRA